MFLSHEFLYEARWKDNTLFIYMNVIADVQGKELNAEQLT